MKILVLDNYDSFTYNLVHLLRELTDAPIDVIRNDKLSVAQADAYDKILLSPGPGIPSEAGIMPQLIQTHAPHKSILGICLGHQGIAEAFGGSLWNMPQVVHGKPSNIHILPPTDPLFESLPTQFEAGRYHSWLVEAHNLPACLRITAQDPDAQIMGIAHTQFDVKGIQFHPESVLTPLGKTILDNWIRS